jgi:hypothetical protein
LLLSVFIGGCCSIVCLFCHWLFLCSCMAACCGAGYLIDLLMLLFVCFMNVNYIFCTCLRLLLCFCKFNWTYHLSLTWARMLFFYSLPWKIILEWSTARRWAAGAWNTNCVWSSEGAHLLEHCVHGVPIKTWEV